jgi:copper chaperone CopZ
LQNYFLKSTLKRTKKIYEKRLKKFGYPLLPVFIFVVIQMKIKNVLLVLLTVMSFSFITSCLSPESKSKKVITVKASDIVKKSIGVNGMTCVGCEVTLEGNISKIEGVVNVKASHTDKEAVIEFDSTKTDIVTITKVIKESGYKPYSK